MFKNCIKFVFKEDVLICSVYIPASDSRVLVASDCNFWEEIEKRIELYSTSGKVYITGDMIAEGLISLKFLILIDIVKTMIYLHIFHIPMRVNLNHFVDSHSRKLTDLCKSSGFIIANGRLGDDRGIGQVSFSKGRDHYRLSFIAQQ